MPEDIDIKRSLRLICAECGERSDLYARGWGGYLALEEDGTETVAVFCPNCVKEEFSDAEFS